MLKVRIAELTRTALRELGVDFSVLGDEFAIASAFGNVANITAILDGGDVNLFIRAFSSNGYGKILAEPTLVTLSGHTARFIAGGEFAVPTAVGVDGISAASTTFRGFGTQLAFTPTVLDKDRIRLHVVPSFSSLNDDIAVEGIPGLNTRAVATTVDLREGQWLAIAGLIQDEQGGARARIPGLGDIPIVGAVFGDQDVRRDETELVVLVSPELVHPMEGEQVPLILPGMAVTEPTGAAFFLHQRIEGRPGCDHRSTVWPVYREQLHDAKKAAVRDARAYAKSQVGFQKCHDYYLNGPVGFSK
jgi:pilus assembly protein CpaC